MKESPGTDLFWESQCVEQLGVSRTRIRELRRAHLTAVVDWQMRDNAVVLTTAGLQKIERVLAGAVMPPTPAASPAVSPRGAAVVPPGPPPMQRFMVVRIPPFRKDSPQRKILLCRECPRDTAPVASWSVAGLLPKLGAERPVRVRDNANFVPGMVLDAVGLAHGLWQYAGRLPRRPGKW